MGSTQLPKTGGKDRNTVLAADRHPAMVVADLHMHTTVSDGTLTLDAVPAAARAAGVEAVAVTDHDRYHPGLNEPVSTRDGIEVVRGIELRAEAATQRVDLLGYGLQETTALRRECERLQQDRIDRGERMVAAVEEATGVSLDVTVESGFSRPELARAIADSDAPYDERGAFRELIGSDCPCYVARDVPSVERAVELLDEACAVVGLAHPFRYDEPDRALDLVVTHELDAVERFYSYDRTRQPDPAPIDRLVADHDLLPIGGSDAHDETLGRAGLDRDQWNAVRSRLPT